MKPMSDTDRACDGGAAGRLCLHAPQKPELAVVGVDVVKSDLFQQQLRVRMRVHNPNDRELPVRSISYEVEVAGKAFAHGESNRQFRGARPTGTRSSTSM